MHLSFDTSCLRLPPLTCSATIIDCECISVCMAEEKERRQLLDDHKESLQRVKEKSANDRKRAEMKFSQNAFEILAHGVPNF